ncbi:MAG: response regulator transcription factor [Chloroflexi bacterium]|nr:response regulator transcription factor [Chloroflexota bacterium]
MGSSTPPRMYFGGRMDVGTVHTALLIVYSLPPEWVPIALLGLPCSQLQLWYMSIRVFLIDEHNRVREVLASRLSGEGDIEVVGSTWDSEEALRRIESIHPDIIVLDPKMRYADGLEVCRRARAVHKDTPVVVLTSYASTEERRLALAAGAVEYMLKDVDTASLTLRIRQLCGGQGMAP